MCFSSGDGGAAAAAQKGAERTRRMEDRRQQRVEVGQNRIDQSFSQFDPQYYDNYKQTYTDYYNPQIADQFAKAQDKMTAVLAGRGTLESTAGASKFADLQKQRSDSEAQVANQASDAANGLKRQVEATKSNLYSINQGAADPKGISARASGEATAIAAPPALSPLGQVFASIIPTMSIYNKSDGTSMNPQLPWNQNGSYTSAPLTGNGSSVYGH